MKFNMKTIFIALAAAICALLIIRVGIMALEGEKGRVKRAIYKAKKFAEKESMIGLIKCTSPDYNDEYGNNRRALLFIARNFFTEYRNILITIDTLEIEVEEENATAHIEATVYWQEGGSSSIIYDTAEVEALFKKEEDQWKLIELKIVEPEKKRFFQPMIG